jgi:tetratricopeptide (TPR) repeat protein
MVKNHKDIITLKAEFDNKIHHSHQDYIRFYEDNKDAIDSIDITLSSENYNTKMDLFCEYGVRLVCAGYFKKGAEILEKAVPMYEFAPDRNSDDLKNDSFFENLLWSYGLALHESKKSKTAIDIFQRLISYYPDNDKYRNWYFGLKIILIKKNLRPVYTIGIVYLICYFTFLRNSDSDMKFILAMISALFLLIIVTMELIIYMLNRKKARPYNTR